MTDPGAREHDDPPTTGVVLRGDRAGVHLTWALPEDHDALVAAAERSRELHADWSPGVGVEARPYLEASARSAAEPDRAAALSYLVRHGPAGELVAVVNANAIVRGGFLSCALGYAAFRPQAGRGRTRRGLALVLDELFGPRQLHRAEANVQPDNLRSAALVRSLGFRHEGTSPRMLRIAGAWRDHERFAILADEWPGADVVVPQRPVPSTTRARAERSRPAEGGLSGWACDRAGPGAAGPDAP